MTNADTATTCQSCGCIHTTRQCPNGCGTGQWSCGGGLANTIYVNITNGGCAPAPPPATDRTREFWGLSFGAGYDDGLVGANRLAAITATYNAGLAAGQAAAAGKKGT